MTKSKGIRIHNRDITEKVYGRWTVISPGERDKHGFARWICRCECGSIRSVSENTLLRGESKSCGCVAREKNSARGRHHESNKTSTYSSWVHMNSRCNNKNASGYKNYGGRGITICERWKKYENFKDDMGEKPGEEYSIDRIDNDGNYEPSNCRWSTRSEQSENQQSKTCPICGRFCKTGAGLALHTKKAHDIK